jgi:DNA-binding Lrp family transcriptional regulator
VALTRDGVASNNEPMNLDPLDRRIMAVLATDARMSFAEIGEVVGLSASAVKRRVDRMRASGAIMGYTAVLDPGALGWNTEAYVEIYCKQATSPSRIAEAVSRHPEVVGAMTVTGDADALLRIRAADIRHFEEVLERIRVEPFILRTSSAVVLSHLLDRVGDAADHDGTGTRNETLPSPANTQ